ncbi:MAG: branched-chain amino acid ABC transporter permease [Actinomycetota bacterium]|nr:branched-chain amino acid ABC transporter permease [Actinomycetota bacterium]
MTATAAETVSAPAISRAPARWRPSAQGWVVRLAVLALVFGGIIWRTATIEQFWADRFALAAIYAVIGLSLNVVLGYVGQVSLGHHGFVGIAAFVSAYYVTEKAGCVANECSFGAFATGIGFGVLSGGVAALLLGLIALRIKGLYLALITLSYGFMAERSIFEIPFLTRGGAGMPAPRPEGFTTDRAYAFLCYAFLALVIFVDWRLLRSKVGRAVLSVKHSEPVAASYGINVTAYKTLAFILSGLFAGLGGGLLAFHTQNVVSNDFNFAIALLWVLMVVVGGLGNRTGVVIGSAFFALFPFLLEQIHWLEERVVESGRAFGQVTIVVGAALAILTMIQFPGGIAEQLSPITRWLRGQKFSMHPEGHGHHKGGHGHKKGALLAKLGLHKNEEAPTEASTEEIRSDAAPALAAQPEEPVGSAGREKEDA